MAEYTKIDGKNLGDIKIYALSTCGWCKKAKAFLNEHNVAYAFIDVDLLSAEERSDVREKQYTFNPAGTFPTIVVDSNYCIVGYDEDKLLKLIGE